MFKTIKAKLIGGFSLITVLIVLVAIFSVVKINESSNGFTDYRGMAKTSLLASGIQTNMLMVRMNVKDYLIHPVQKEVDEFQTYYDKTSKLIVDAKMMIQEPKVATMIGDVSKGFADYKADFEEVQQLMQQRNEIVKNGLNLIGPKMEKSLTSVMREEVKLGDFEIVTNSAEAVRTLMMARLYTVKFMENNEQSAMNKVLEEFENLNSQIWILKSMVDSEKLTDELQLVSEDILEYKEKVEHLYKVVNDRNDIVTKKLNVVGPQIAKLADDIKSSMKAEQDRIGLKCGKTTRIL